MCLRAEISSAHSKKTPSFTYTKCLPAVPSCPFSGWFKGRGAQLTPGGRSFSHCAYCCRQSAGTKRKCLPQSDELACRKQAGKGRVAPPHPKKPQSRPSPNPYYQPTAPLSCRRHRCSHSRCHICHVAQGSTATIVKEVGRWGHWGEDEERDAGWGGSAARRDMGILRNVLRARGISILDGAEWGRLFLFLWLPERLH